MALRRINPPAQTTETSPRVPTPLHPSGLAVSREELAASPFRGIMIALGAALPMWAGIIALIRLFM
jgi:hypothetical protein